MTSFIRKTLRQIAINSSQLAKLLLIRSLKKFYLKVYSAQIAIGT